jgi:tRNA(Arg) A34 adenosine deaminase TadA
MECREPAGLMRLAIEKAREGLAIGQSPFGCAIARDGEVLAVAHNSVWRTTDITAHAEINAIREACGRVGNIFLDGAIVATTCEPCPMCMSALHWARVQSVYFGATIADAAQSGFHELSLAAADLLRLGHSPVKLIGGCHADDCKKLFDEWRASPQFRPY